MTPLVTAIASVLPKRRPIHHHEPYTLHREQQNITKCLEGGLANDDWIRKLEEELRRTCGATQAIAVSSGTAALHVTLLAAGIKPGEEVLVPSLTFAGTANAVSYCGAIPNFVDGPLGISAYKLRRYLERTTCANPDKRGRLNCKTGRVISALIAVDLLGFPADMQKLSAVADEFGLILIEDAAQALGAKIGNQPCGSFGRAAILSFNNNKIVTGNGGGAVLTNDEWLAAKAHQLATTARVTHPWKVEHDAIAYNYRMGAINGALACAQMERLPVLLVAKRALLARYEGALGDFKGVAMLKATEVWHGQPNYWLSSLIFKRSGDCTADRDELLAELHDHGIYARSLFTPLHKLPMYAGNPRDTMQYAENTFSRVVCLPSGFLV